MLAEQIERERKKKTPAKATYSGISINFRPTVNKSKPSKGATGTLDSFVIRKKFNISEKTSSELPQKSLKDFFTKKSKNQSLYKEFSSADSDP